MNKTALHWSNFALALCLAAVGGAVLAKGPGTEALQDQAATQYDCTSTSQSASTTAKSPQPALSHSCMPAASRTESLPTGDTTAKTPSRTRESVR